MAGEMITSDFQIQIGATGSAGALLLGAGTPYDVQELDGWDDLPTYSLTDVMRPSQAGAWPGPMYPQTRVITITLDASGTVNGIGTVTTAQYSANLDALRLATNPGSDTTAEVPFAVRQAGRILTASVRCQQRAMPTTQGYASPGLDNITLQLVATDPRRYAQAVQTASCTPAASSGGLTYPITYPLTWGTVTSPGTLTITNSGDYNTPPVFTITGPCSIPSITRQDTGQQVLFDVTLSATDVLTVSPLDSSVTLNGSAIYAALDPTSAPIAGFLMPTGMTTIGLHAATGTPTLTATWQSAYL